jgi:hypothetical protein
MFKEKIILDTADSSSLQKKEDQNKEIQTIVLKNLYENFVENKPSSIRQDNKFQISNYNDPFEFFVKKFKNLDYPSSYYNKEIQELFNFFNTQINNVLGEKNLNEKEKEVLYIENIIKFLINDTNFSLRSCLKDTDLLTEKDSFYERITDFLSKETQKSLALLNSSLKKFKEIEDKYEGCNEENDKEQTDHINGLCLLVEDPLTAEFLGADFQFFLSLGVYTHDIGKYFNTTSETLKNNQTNNNLSEKEFKKIYQHTNIKNPHIKELSHPLLQFIASSHHSETPKKATEYGLANHQEVKERLEFLHKNNVLNKEKLNKLLISVKIFDIFQSTLSLRSYRDYPMSFSQSLFEAISQIVFLDLEEKYKKWVIKNIELQISLIPKYNELYRDFKEIKSQSNLNIERDLEYSFSSYDEKDTGLEVLQDLLTNNDTEFIIEEILISAQEKGIITENELKDKNYEERFRILCKKLKIYLKKDELKFAEEEDFIIKNPFKENLNFESFKKSTYYDMLIYLYNSDPKIKSENRRDLKDKMQKIRFLQNKIK